MVEKVFISPNRVRAYGNIVNMKTGDDFTLVNSELTVTTDMVDGAEMTVFQFEVEGGISIALTSSSSTCNVGDNVLLTATVLDDNTPVEAAEVTFKLGETTLGADETDANGVATYTYTTSIVGSLSFSATYQDSASNSVSVTVNHSYSIAFSQSSYVATGGSATLECTLLEDNVAKTGASITITGTDSSTYTATTNSSGVASVTVTGISASTVFTATYQGATATCTVTAQSYLFYDACSSATGLSNYGSSVLIRGTNAAITMTYDSTENAYKLVGTGKYFAMIPIPTLNDEDEYTITANIKGQNKSLNGIGFCLDNRSDTTSYSQAVWMEVYGKKLSYKQFKVSSDGTYKSGSVSSLAGDTWYKIEMTVNGSSLSGKLYDSGGTELTSLSSTLSVSNKQMGIFLQCESGSTNSVCYVKEIKAEAL